MLHTVDQREEVRVSIPNVNVVLDDPDKFRMAAARDASRNGLCLATEKPYSLGETVRMIPLNDQVFSITNAVTYELVGEVVWTGEDVMVPADSDRRFLMGLRLQTKRALA